MVLESIIRRRSVRVFAEEPVLEQSIETIIKAAQFAPTAQNNKAVEFIVIREQKVKDKLFDVLGQDFLKQAPVILVLASDSTKSPMPEADLALASGFVMIQASELLLGTVWKNVPPELRDKVREALSMPENFEFINVIPLGYPLDEPPQHSDAEFDKSKIHYERW
jgi:nitroreductase